MLKVELWAGVPKVSNEGFFDGRGSYTLHVNLDKRITFEDALKVLKETVSDKGWRERRWRGNRAIKMDGVIGFLWEPKPWEYPKVIEDVVENFTHLYISTASLHRGLRLPGTWTWNGEKFIQNTNASGTYMSAIGERYIEDVVYGVQCLIQLHLDNKEAVNPEIEKLLVKFINGWLLLISRSYNFEK